MFVLCPHCQFLVALDPASGQPPPRCPRCDALLQAQSEGTASPPAESPPAQEAGAEATEPAAAQEAFDTAQMSSDGDDALKALDDSGIAACPADPDSELADARTTATPEANSGSDAPLPAGPLDTAHKYDPSFVRVQTAETTLAARRRWPMPASIIGLALLLLLQMVLADRAQLAADPHWRPALSTLCRMLRCSLPAWHEPAAFTLLDRDVRPDPRNPGALRVTASFRNDAHWPQPWPALLLTLSDVDGRVAGTRLFAPREYLAAATATRNGLASGQSASIAMEVMEPTARIVAFTFDFR